MRLSNKTRAVIEQMEKQGYIWLSHLDTNSQMRFRNLTRKGFDKFIKVAGPGKNGLTFLTKEVADFVVCGGASQGKRKTAFEQISCLKEQVAKLEAENESLRAQLLRTGCDSKTTC